MNDILQNAMNITKAPTGIKAAHNIPTPIKAKMHQLSLFTKQIMNNELYVQASKEIIMLYFPQI